MTMTPLRQAYRAYDDALRATTDELVTTLEEHPEVRVELIEWAANHGFTDLVQCLGELIVTDQKWQQAQTQEVVHEILGRDLVLEDPRRTEFA